MLILEKEVKCTDYKGTLFDDFLPFYIHCYLGRTGFCFNLK